jgi:metallo-beta-lactamase family protein
MLRDAAMIQEQDARYLNRRHAREGRDERVVPLYASENVQPAIERFFSLPLHRPLAIAPGVTVRFHNSGHVLGSALVELELQERGRHVRLLFTGDLGRAELPHAVAGDRARGRLADVGEHLRRSFASGHRVAR